MFIQQSLGGWRTALLLGLTTLLLAPAEGMEDLNLESRVGYEGRHKIIEDLNYYVKAERRERIRSKYGLTGVECPNTVRIMERHGREVCGNELGTKRIHHSRAMVYDNKVACKRCTDFCLPHMDRFAKPCCVAGMKEDGEITCGCRTSVCEECGEPRTQCDQSTWVSHSLHWPPTYTTCTQDEEGIYFLPCETCSTDVPECADCGLPWDNHTVRHPFMFVMDDPERNYQMAKEYKLRHPTLTVSSSSENPVDSSPDFSNYSEMLFTERVDCQRELVASGCT